MVSGCCNAFPKHTYPLGLGWRWQKWITAMLVGVNLVMVVFFTPETRFHREVNRLTPCLPEHEFPDRKSEGLKHTIAQTHKVIPSPLRKSKIRELNPWSGIDRNVSYLNLYLRPFPLVLYPACLFAALSCESTDIKKRAFALNSTRLWHIGSHCSLSLCQFLCPGSSTVQF